MTCKSLLLALRELPATGADGFEGLLALALSRIAGAPMRLAASGHQFGVDGQSASPTTPVCFEAKRYSSKLPREMLLSKIADLGRRKDDAEILWVLGATVGISNQDAQDIETDGKKHGIATLILDWNDQSAPSLGVVLANAGDDIASWIASRTKAEVSREDIEKDLQTLRSDDLAKERWLSLRVEFSAREISARQTIEANKSWLKATLSSVAKARYRLGQPTAPCQQDRPVVRRETAFQKIEQSLANETTCLVLGTEGVGKSWIAAEAALEYPGLAVTLSAEKLENVQAGDFENLLIEAFAAQTENAPGNSERWKRRFAAWEASHPSPGFLIVVDGINQRPDLPWDKLLNTLESLVEDRGGRLLVTSRPQFYQRHVERGFNRTKRVVIENWNADERNSILDKAGISPATLDATALSSLLNPRLLGIAIEVLPTDDPIAWAGLTVESLLFEHINRTQRDGFEEQSPAELCAALSNRAGRVLDALRIDKEIKSEIIFEDDLLAVKETRFFQSKKGPQGGYVLKDEGLSLALGFALVDQILSQSTNEGQFEESARNLIEPIAALDQTSSVVLAAMHVCACDPERKDTTLFTVLVGAFCELQNLNEDAYPQFFDVVRRNPDATLSAAKEKLLEWRHPINEKWLVASIKQMLGHEPTRPIVTQTLAEWLRHVNIDALDQQSRYGPQKEKDKESAAKRQKEIDDAISAFSQDEQRLFDRCHIIKGDNDSLLTQAFELLAGQPLAPWADAFATFGLGRYIDHTTHQAHKAFFQLVQFNRVDPIESGQAYLEVAKPFRAPQASRAGKWCLVKLLYATGREEDAKEAFELGTALRKEQNAPSFYFSRQENLCASDPCDPTSKQPDNVVPTIDKFGEMDVTAILTAMNGNTPGTMEYNESLCAVSRFGPETAVKKGSELCRSIVVREGMPLRQLALCGTTLVPLLGRRDALELSRRLQEGRGFETIDANDLNVVKYDMTNFALPFLSGDEQLELLSAEFLGGNYSLDAIPSFKKPSEPAVLARLEECFMQRDDEAAFSTLSLVAHTFDEISDVLEISISRFIDCESSLVRSAVFEIALSTDSKLLRGTHLNSGWSVQEDAKAEKYENAYGSALLIDAAVNEEVSFDEILPRISFESWALAQERIGGQVTKAIVSLLDARLRKAAARSKELAPPEVKIHITPHDHVLHSFRSVDERKAPSEKKDLASIFGDDESNEEFHNRQKRNHRLFDEMEDSMSDKDILVIAQQIDFKSYKDILSAYPGVGVEWASLLLTIPDDQLSWFKDFAFVISANLASVDEPKAIQLLKKAIACEGFIRRMYRDGLSLEKKTIWSWSRSKVVETLWRERLTSCASDDLIALEVLAAERFGAQEFIRDYTEYLLNSERPIDHALAVTIAGFSQQLDHFGPIVGTLEASEGFVGKAIKAAQVAHDKAQWSLHWVARMWNADTPEEFWLNLNLAAKIMDARLDYDSSIYTPENKWHGFASPFVRARKDRVQKWNRVREKTLYGNEKPDEIFLRPENAL